MEARNLRNMTMAQTPLLGDENTPLHVGPGGGSGFESATPRHQVAFTPNPLATPMRPGSLDVSATPHTQSRGGVSATPLRTPLRDNLSINPDEFSASNETPRDQQLRTNYAKRALKAGFMNLPKPENNFELLVPDEEEAEPEDKVMTVEDAADRDAEMKRRQELEERKAFARRSQAVQRGLPRPANVDISRILDSLSLSNDGESALGNAQRLIDIELANLLHHDSIAYPLPGTTKSGSSHSTYVAPDDDSLEAAKVAIHAELAALVGFPSANSEQLREGLLQLSKTEDIPSDASWASLKSRLTYDSITNSWVEPASLSSEARVAGYTSLLNDTRDVMTKEANKAAKMEKKLGVTLGGYQQRAQAIAKRINTAFEEIQKNKLEFDSFSRLRANEEAVGPRRVASLREEVERLEHREKMLQMRYAELTAEKQESEARVALLEEKVMLEAEAYNEAQLAAMEEE